MSNSAITNASTGGVPLSCSTTELQQHYPSLSFSCYNANVTETQSTALSTVKPPILMTSQSTSGISVDMSPTTADLAADHCSRAPVDLDAMLVYDFRTADGGTRLLPLDTSTVTTTPTATSGATCGSSLQFTKLKLAAAPCEDVDMSADRYDNLALHQQRSAAKPLPTTHHHGSNGSQSYTPELVPAPSPNSTANATTANSISALLLNISPCRATSKTSSTRHHPAAPEPISSDSAAPISVGQPEATDSPSNTGTDTLTSIGKSVWCSNDYTTGHILTTDAGWQGVPRTSSKDQMDCVRSNVGHLRDSEVAGGMPSQEVAHNLCVVCQMAACTCALWASQRVAVSHGVSNAACNALHINRAVGAAISDRRVLAMNHDIVQNRHCCSMRVHDEQYHQQAAREMDDARRGVVNGVVHRGAAVDMNSSNIKLNTTTESRMLAEGNNGDKGQYCDDANGELSVCIAMQRQLGANSCMHCLNPDNNYFSDSHTASPALQHELSLEAPCSAFSLFAAPSCHACIDIPVTTSVTNACSITGANPMDIEIPFTDLSSPELLNIFKQLQVANAVERSMFSPPGACTERASYVGPARMCGGMLTDVQGCGALPAASGGRETSSRSLGVVPVQQLSPSSSTLVANSTAAASTEAAQGDRTGPQQSIAEGYTKEGAELDSALNIRNTLLWPSHNMLNADAGLFSTEHSLPVDTASGAAHCDYQYVAPTQLADLIGTTIKEDAQQSHMVWLQHHRSMLLANSKSGHCTRPGRTPPPRSPTSIASTCASLNTSPELLIVSSLQQQALQDSISSIACANGIPHLTAPYCPGFVGGSTVTGTVHRSFGITR